MPAIENSESRIEFIWLDYAKSAICVYLTAVCGKRDLVALIFEPESVNPVYYPLGSVGIRGLKKILMAWEGIDLNSVVRLGDQNPQIGEFGS